jgi:hypothetical protein
MIPIDLHKKIHDRHDQELREDEIEAKPKGGVPRVEVKLTSSRASAENPEGITGEAANKKWRGGEDNSQTR